MISAIFEQFVEASPVSVMFRVLSTVKAALKAVHGVGKIEAGCPTSISLKKFRGPFET